MGHHNRALTVLAGVLALGLGRAAGTSPDPVEVLKQATAKVLASASCAPNYTCVETVERNWYRPLAPTAQRVCPAVVAERSDYTSRLSAVDRLRMDVTILNGAEIFSWVGASRFEDAGIDQLVRQGPIGTGAFGAFLQTIFAEDVKQFHFEGHKLVDATDLMEYSFRVAKKDSHYRVKVRSSWETTEYFGSVFVNPATTDVVRLEIETAGTPVANGACKSRATLNFSMVDVGARPFLLPTSSLQRFVLNNGASIENSTNFTNCREYHGESSVTYGPLPSAPAENVRQAFSANRPAQPVRVEGGLPFTLVLLDPIDTDHAAAGDPFLAKLAMPLKDKQTTLAPAGAIVEGRLRRVQNLVERQQVFVVLAPRELRIGDTRVPFAANRDWAYLINGKSSKKLPLGMTVLLPQLGEAPAGVFQFIGPHVVVPAGFHSEWRTVTVRPN